MVPTREADEQPALKHVIQRGDLLGYSNRVMRGKRVTHDACPHTLRMKADEKTEHAGMVVDLETFDLQMVLRLAIASVA